MPWHTAALAAAKGGLRADETRIYVRILGIFSTQYTFESKYATIAHQKCMPAQQSSLHWH